MQLLYTGSKMHVANGLETQLTSFLYLKMLRCNFGLFMALLTVPALGSVNSKVGIIAQNVYKIGPLRSRCL